MKFIVGKVYKDGMGIEHRVLVNDAPGNYPIITMDTLSGYPRAYTEQGYFFGRFNRCTNDLVCPTEKRTGWINVYPLGVTDNLHSTRE